MTLNKREVMLFEIYIYIYIYIHIYLYINVCMHVGKIYIA